DASLLLARFKRREYVRIMLRDVLKLAPLAETTAEISALADVLIEAALRDAQNLLQRRYEAPQHLDSEGRLVDTPFAILSLGKLGGEGELAISLSHALNYYAHGAHDWERQALIKVRYSAGDETLTREFIRGVQRHIYGGGREGADRLNFEAIATSLASREKMHTRRRRSSLYDSD